MTTCRALCLACFVLLTAHASAGQATDQTIRLRLLLPLARPAGLAAHPESGVLVSDASEGRVIRVDSTGLVLGQAAESGADGAFSPAGLDPTNGLVLIVADPESGRILRFARDGRFLESMPVTSGGQSVTTAFDRRDSATSASADGRPVSVASTEDGRMFVVDESVSAVRVYDLNRRLLRTVGREVGDEYPILPLSVTAAADRIYVLDAGLPGLVVLDRFGSFLRTIGAGASIAPVSTMRGPSGLWVVSAERILLFSLDGLLVGAYSWNEPTRALGVAEADGRLYVLGRDGLHVTPLPSFQR